MHCTSHLPSLYQLSLLRLDNILPQLATGFAEVQIVTSGEQAGGG